MIDCELDKLRIKNELYKEKLKKARKHITALKELIEYKTHECMSKSLEIVRLRSRLEESEKNVRDLTR